MELVHPHYRYRDSYLAALEELAIETERLSWIYPGAYAEPEMVAENFHAYVAALLKLATEPPEGFVHDTVYWAVEGDEVIGRISLRHRLNGFLAKFGGHVGYIVRPSRRLQGHASSMLGKVLATPRAREIGRLLLTCDADNLASEKTILKNGGVFESEIPTEDGLPKRRFWITV